MNIGGIKLDTAEFASQGSALLGIRDSGKTYDATVIAEQYHDEGVPFVAFDPIGVWRFLRRPGLHKGGKGYPIVVAGGKEGDLPLTPASAPAIVEAAMHEGVSLVIDLFDITLSKADWRRIVRDCVRLMLHRNGEHGLRHIFLEEAAEFAPQKVLDGDVYAEIEKLARMGGNSRLGYTLINQRSQEVNKAVLELCENLFLHRQRGKNAIEALDKWLGIAGADTKAITASLPTLGQGECWAWIGGDKPTPPQLIKFQRKNSLHPDRRVMRGDVEMKAKPVNVGKFVTALQSALPKVEAEAAANDPKRLRARVAELERQLNAKGGGATKEQMLAEYQRGKADGAEQAWPKAQAEGIRHGEAQMLARCQNALNAVRTTQGAQVEAKRNGSAAPAYRNGDRTAPKGPPPTGGGTGVKAPPAPATFKPTATPLPADATLSAPQKRVLEAIAFWRSIGFDSPTRAQIAAAAGYSASSGGLANLISQLRGMGMVEPARGDGTETLTGAGVAASPTPDGSVSVRDRLGRVLSRPQARVLDALPVDGRAIDRESLATACEYSPTSGGFANLLSELRTLGVVTYPNKNEVAIEPWVLQ